MLYPKRIYDPIKLEKVKNFLNIYNFLDELTSVGWGSRETQFQGAAGRKNREKVDVNKIPVGIDENLDNFQTIVAWRADAQFFTVNSVDEFVGVNGRQLRVWNRDLELMSKCEVLAGIESVLSMK